MSCGYVSDQVVGSLVALLLVPYCSLTLAKSLHLPIQYLPVNSGSPSLYVTLSALQTYISALLDITTSDKVSYVNAPSDGVADRLVCSA